MSQDVYPRIDPRTIVVDREGRQRQENIADVSDLKQSISQLRQHAPSTGGLINPIVVRRVDDKTVLVAGERRLKAVLELDLPDVPYRLFEELTQTEAEIVELEENVKRRELAWKDHVRAVGRIHELYRQANNGKWTIERTANAISLDKSHVGKILQVYEALDSGRITKADSIEQAYNTIQRFAERKAESIVGDLIVKGAAIFGDLNSATTTSPPVPSASPPPDPTFTTTTAVAMFTESDTSLLGEAPQTPLAGPVASPTPILAPISAPLGPVVCAEFGEWVRAYNGPKFTLIHCDFPYGNYKGNDSKGAMSVLETEEFYDNTESVYWNLLDILTSNLDRIMSYSAHMVFWFNMNFYTETVSRLRRAGLTVHDHPLVWHKTGGPGGLGVAPGTEATHPRRTYDTALLALRGGRPLVRSLSNSYAAPTAGNKIHPSQKPEPMLRYFLQMVVDETTTVFDPTCGSAAALRACEDLGAKAVLGLELDPNYAAAANTRTLQARIMRQAGSLRREEVA